MSLAVAQVSRRRADQLGDLVGMLELGAVDLDAGMRIAKQRLRHGFHYARLAGAGWPQKKEISNWPSWRVQSGEKHLVDFGYLFDGRVLAYNFAPQRGFEFQRVAAP